MKSISTLRQSHFKFVKFDESLKLPENEHKLVTFLESEYLSRNFQFDASDKQELIESIIIQNYDRKGIFKLALKIDNDITAKNIYEALHEQKGLMSQEQRFKFHSLSSSLFEKINCDDYLENLYRSFNGRYTSHDKLLVEVILEKIRNEKFHRYLCSACKNHDSFREVSIKKITDQEFLFEYIRTQDGFSIMEAVDSITDMTVLKRVADLHIGASSDYARGILERIEEEEREKERIIEEKRLQEQKEAERINLLKKKLLEEDRMKKGLCVHCGKPLKLLKFFRTKHFRC